MDKLAEEIRNKHLPIIHEDAYDIGVIEAMLEYHEAKLKEELIKFIECQLPSKNQEQKNNRYKAVIEYLKQ